MKDRGQIRDLAALRWLAGGESVILYGPVGVGKSHIAQALGAPGGPLTVPRARFFKTSRVLAHVADGRADRTWDKRLGELTRPAVLILDLSRYRGKWMISRCARGTCTGRCWWTSAWGTRWTCCRTVRPRPWSRG